MRLSERMHDVRDGARMRMLSDRLERVDRDRERLRFENDVLRDRLGRADAERAKWLTAFEAVSSRAPGETTHHVRRTIVIATTAGSAYVFGARAGRERYEQLRAWWDGFRARASSRKDEAADGSVGELSRGEDLVREDPPVLAK